MSLRDCILPQYFEELTVRDKYNESIMTGLRTKWGIDLGVIENFNLNDKKNFNETITKYLKTGHLKRDGKKIKLSNKGKLLTDLITAELFL